MRVIIVDEPEDVGRVGGGVIADVLRGQPAPILGVATGASPLAAYAALAAEVEAGTIDLRGATGFALDEYVGVDPADSRSYAWFVRERIERLLGMRFGSIRVPDGRASDLDAEAAGFEAAIVAAGGIDVQILGIGRNGHVGFNEPSSALASRTRVKTLADTTRHDNARFFDDPEEVPTLCLTQGLGTIMDARNIVLLATGAAKARAVAAAIEGPVSSLWPASVLQFHPRATAVIDRAAAAGLTLQDYYLSVTAP